MQNRMPIVVALLAAVLAVVFVNMYISDLQTSLEPPRTTVVVAAEPLRAGQILEEKSIMMSSRASDSLPRLAIPWAERGNYIGQPLGADVAANDYLLSNYFGSGIGEAAQRASEKVDAGRNQRLFTIPVSGESALEGAIRAGDRVDLILSYDLQPEATKPGSSMQPLVVTTSLLDNVYVLYTGTFGSPSAAGYSSITVLVTPEEAKLLIWAMRLGRLSVLLRNPKDLKIAENGYVQGDQTTLKALGGTAIRPADVVAGRRQTEQP